MKGRMLSAIQNTYEAIASDLESIGPLSLDSAVEMTLDADRVSMYGYDDEAVQEIGRLDFYERQALAREALKGYF